MRTTITLAIALAALLAAGCGYDTDKDAAGRLTPQQFEQIDAVYQAQVPHDDATTPAELRAAARDMAAVCTSLDRADPLVRALAGTCEPGVATTQALIRVECEEALGTCARSTREVAQLMGRLVEAMREVETVIAHEVESEACRDALAPPGLTNLFADAQQAFAGFSEALVRGDAEAIEDQGARFEAAEQAMERYGTTAQQRERFREVCRPE